MSYGVVEDCSICRKAWQCFSPFASEDHKGSSAESKHSDAWGRASSARGGAAQAQAQAECMRVLDKAGEFGQFMLYTSNAHGPRTNEEPIGTSPRHEEHSAEADATGRAVEGKRDKYVIATECGFDVDDDFGVDSSPEKVKSWREGVSICLQLSASFRPQTLSVDRELTAQIPNAYIDPTGRPR